MTTKEHIQQVIADYEEIIEDLMECLKVIDFAVKRRLKKHIVNKAHVGDVVVYTYDLGDTVSFGIGIVQVEVNSGILVTGVRDFICHNEYVILERRFSKSTQAR